MKYLYPSEEFAEFIMSMSMLVVVGVLEDEVGKRKVVCTQLKK